MKAAVLHQLGQAPKFEDFPDPVPANADQLVMTVKAASLKNLDKGRASGQHYASYPQLPVVVGFDGTGLLADGTRVYAIGLTGMMAEKALINKNAFVKIPAGLDDVKAAALANGVFGAALALRFRAGIKPGETILINGATSVTGALAVQIAKHYGAKKVIATGRNAALLENLRRLGADEIISLKQDDKKIVDHIKQLHQANPISIVLDYLWGHPAELILSALKGGSNIHAFTSRVRFVTVGGMAGETIQLPSGILRSSDIEILGSGIGSLSKEDMQKTNSEVLPEMMQLAAEGKLEIQTETAPLKDIETAWEKSIAPGKRLVIII
jgi:NADPH:quinone reductase-like Zn-dependent oxidoreductase